MRRLTLILSDLYLPEGVRPLVAVGQTMVGGETVLAELLP